MPAHASQDAGPSEEASAGPLTRRRFLTYVVAAPVLTVAASSIAPDSSRQGVRRRAEPTAAREHPRLGRRHGGGNEAS